MYTLYYYQSSTFWGQLDHMNVHADSAIGSLTMKRNKYICL